MLGNQTNEQIKHEKTGKKYLSAKLIERGAF